MSEQYQFRMMVQNQIPVIPQLGDLRFALQVTNRREVTGNQCPVIQHDSDAILTVTWNMDHLPVDSEFSQKRTALID